MGNTLNAALAENVMQTVKPLTDSPEHLKNLTDFVSKNVVEVFEYAMTTFGIGLGIILVAILVSYGIFKALSVFQNLINL